MAYNMVMDYVEKIVPYILYFFLYSILGYAVEVAVVSIHKKKLLNRGFLFGPWLPIYGFGVVFVILSAGFTKGNTALTFFVSMVVCSVLEYITSWAMEKMFGIKWWDYSKSDKFNLHGRICLRNCLLFGLGGCLVIYKMQPFAEKIIAWLGEASGVVAGILLGLIILDAVASFYAVEKVKRSGGLKKTVGDQTNEVKRLARLAIADLVSRGEKMKQKIKENNEKFREMTRKNIEKQIKRNKELLEKLEKYKK